MTELYGRADVFVLPTHGDCTPLVIAEAMASGLPVIATDLGSIADMVAAGRNGTLVAPGRPDELAAAIEQLAVDRARRAEMGRASRLLAEQEHDAEANCSRIFALMRLAAGERHPATVLAGV
jgi:glycosyltransferase involved in cell wall biosynthesis